VTARAPLALIVACAMWGSPALPIGVSPGVAYAATAELPHAADSPVSKSRPNAGATRAPSNPPLTSAGGEADAGAEEGASASASSSAGDPLVTNGLGSPMCRAGAGEDDLSRASEENCQASGFEAAPEPTGNYAFDVHINTGVAKVTNDLSAAFQNVLGLGWTVLVAAVHGVIVMLEWCYTIDLLNSSAMSGVARGLRETQATFTQPWLVFVLTVASVLALYHGIVRRRVAETLGHALLMLAMMAGGFWVIMNPTGTVGALDQWANQAGLGTLGAVAAGTPDHPDRTLADSMSAVFSGAVVAPWCFMEFGNVRWCSDPARLDPRLRTSGLAIAAVERAQIGCRAHAGSLAACAQPRGGEARALSESAEQLAGARTNGDLFLALPANQAMRNSINDHPSLYNTLCGGSETPCRGPTAAQAEFRTEHGTGWRFMGLVFIWIGVLGMLLTLGFVAMHLLGAALTSLLYLLLAPAAVLAPALGDGGRAAFRGWATGLLGALMSKLIYSFVLGVVLSLEHILTVDLTVLGWFTQWLLVSAMWWGAFARRHQLLGFAQAGHAQPREPRSLARRVGGALETPKAAWRTATPAKAVFSKRGSDVETTRKRAQAARERAKSGSEEQAGRTLEREHRDASGRRDAAPRILQQLSARRAQLARVRSAHAKASGSGDARRSAELKHREQRIEGDIERQQGGLNAARRLAGDGEQLLRAGGKPYTREQAEARNRFLDAQAALPSSARARGSEPGQRRDYAALAGLAGFGRDEYERLDAHGQRAARLQVDRELAARKERNRTAGDLAATESSSPLGRRERHKLDREFDSALAQRMRDGGHTMPSGGAERSNIDLWRSGGRSARASGGSRESSVMRDAHEVAARRKRQLGRSSR
jgi:hypothetical protein